MTKEEFLGGVRGTQSRYDAADGYDAGFEAGKKMAIRWFDKMWLIGAIINANDSIGGAEYKQARKAAGL